MSNLSLFPLSLQHCSTPPILSPFSLLPPSLSVFLHPPLPPLSHTLSFPVSHLSFPPPSNPSLPLVLPPSVSGINTQQGVLGRERLTRGRISLARRELKVEHTPRQNNRRRKRGGEEEVEDKGRGRRRRGRRRGKEGGGGGERFKYMRSSRSVCEPCK